MNYGELAAEAVKLDGLCPEETLASLSGIPLLQLCKEMQPLLTDEASVNAALRTLTKAAVRHSPLHPEELSVLVTFLAKKAAAPSFSNAAASSLKMIVDSADHIGVSMTRLFELVVDVFLPEIRLQERVVAVRRTCFTILRSVIDEQTVSAAAVCSAKRLRAVLDALDGEGDPQLVVTMFDIVHDLLSWPEASVVKATAEAFFEALSSYFPVLFTQPPGCPVTKKDLQDGLSKCLSHPALEEFSIPFLLGKIVSPSTVVKMDVVDTMQRCVARMPCTVLFNTFARDIVTALRNEVVKMSAYLDHSGTSSSTTAATPLNVISSCCTVLNMVAKLCGGHDGSDTAKLMMIFEPLSEGIIQSVQGSAPRHTCSAYATMLFNVMLGSWPVCLAVGGYVFTMLTVVTTNEEGVRSAENCNTLMAFSALCAGFVDVLDTFDKDESAESETARSELRAKLVNALPTFTDIVKLVCALLQETDKAPTGTAVDVTTQEMLSLSQVELLSSVLRLDQYLTPWMQDDELEGMANALVAAAVFGAPVSVRLRASRLLSGFVVDDPDNRAQQAVLWVLARAGELSHSPALSVASVAVAKDGMGVGAGEESGTQAFLELLKALSEASLTFARFALEEILLPSGDVGENSPRTRPLVPLDPMDRNRVVVDILGNFATLDDDTAATLLARLLGSPPDPAFLESLRTVFAKATRDYREQAFTKRDDPNGILVKAAVLSCGPALASNIVQEAEAIQLLLPMFARVLQEHQASPSGKEVSFENNALPLGEDELWRTVAMNGITGAVVCAIPTGTQGMDLGDVSFTIAFLWGLCLRTGEAPSGRGVSTTAAATNNDDDDRPVDETAHLVSAKLKELFDSPTAAAAVVTALAYSPLLVDTRGAAGGSLLAPYLDIAGEEALPSSSETEHSLAHEAAYWRGLHALLTNEDVRHIRACELSLLRLMASVGTTTREVEAGLVRAVVFLLDRKGAAAFLHKAVASHTELLRAVCGGLGSPAMSERLAALAYLSSAAEIATEECRPTAHTQNPVQRKLFQDVRDLVLRETLPILADKKRLVRQAAGRCRNAWYRVK